MKVMSTRGRQSARQNAPGPALLDLESLACNPAHAHRVALIDSTGNIVGVNNQWMTFAEQARAAPNRVGPGANYLEVCRRASVASRDARTALRGLEAVLKQKIPSFAMDYECSTPSGAVCFHMSVTPMHYQNAPVVIIHTETTTSNCSKNKSNNLPQEFAQRLINAQEDERRRISQEMHDDFGNRIALLALSVRHLLKVSKDNPTLQHLCSVYEQLLDFAAATRELSHGLHPIVLRYAGITAALNYLRQNFEKSHDIQMDLEIAAELPHLQDDVSLCIFRVAQEALQNVVRHSRARRVSAVLARVAGGICLRVSDNGRGFVRSELPGDGLGLQSMEARALSVGGRLIINSCLGAGTEIRLAIPLKLG